jgi:hypothetical protein
MKEDKGKEKKIKEGGVRKALAQPTSRPIYPSPGMTYLWLSRSTIQAFSTGVLTIPLCPSLTLSSLSATRL